MNLFKIRSLSLSKCYSKLVFTKRFQKLFNFYDAITMDRIYRFIDNFLPNRIKLSWNKLLRKNVSIFFLLFSFQNVRYDHNNGTWSFKYTHIHTQNTHRHTHIYIYIYIYIYICVCVCVCVCSFFSFHHV